jgi:transcriptional regulator with XRE-family HTH domain
MTLSSSSNSFFWQWRNATGDEKDAICQALDVSRNHLSSVANGSKPAKQTLKMALARYLNTNESILFPDGCPSKRKHGHPSHMVNQNTLGHQI